MAKNNNVISAADLFGAVKVEALEIPELAAADGTPRFVHVKRLSAADALRFYASQSATATQEEKTQGMVEMMANALVNPDGSRLIDESEMYKVGDIPMSIFKLVVDKVNSLSGIGTDASTDTKAGGETAEGKG